MVCPCKILNIKSHSSLYEFVLALVLLKFYKLAFLRGSSGMAALVLVGHTAEGALWRYELLPLTATRIFLRLGG